MHKDEWPQVAPVCVIHGPFGSGKSSLLVAMLEFFAGILPKSGRVLVAAHTNLAVDRVLLGLLEHGFTGQCTWHNLLMVV